MRIFEHNFVADKAKIRRRAVARQEFLTQSAAKFAEKTGTYACEDRFLSRRMNNIMELSDLRNKIDEIDEQILSLFV